MISLALYLKCHNNRVLTHGRIHAPWVLTIVCAFILNLFGIQGKVSADENRFPFSPGEKLTMKVRWGVIPAGEATLEVLPHKVVKGLESLHFVLTVKTTPFVDFFYKVRDRIDSYADRKMTRSLLYVKTKRGRKKKHIVVEFDWERKKATYSNMLRKGKRRHRKPISLPSGTFDPMAVFYAFRLQDLERGLELECPVTDGKKCVMGRAKVIKKEKINLGGHSFNTFLVEPDLKHLEGIFEKSKDATLKIWVTADQRKIPIRIESKVIVGSFVGEIASIENNGKIEFLLEKENDAPPQPFPGNKKKTTELATHPKAGI